MDWVSDPSETEMRGRAACGRTAQNGYRLQSTVRPPEAYGRQTYVPICISSLLADRPPFLDLYELVQGQYVLYCRADAVFTTEVHDRLLASGIATLYAPLVLDGSSDGPDGPDVATVLRLPDDQVPPLLKAGLLYRSAVAVARLAFAAAADPATVAAASKAAGQVVTGLMRETSYLRVMLGLLDHSESVLSHSVNTCAYAVILGHALGMNGLELHQLGLTAFLHDVGKAWVPVDILNKPTELSAAEWETMRRHPDWSVELLAGAGLAAGVLAGIRGHHERLDGSGYPLGLRGAEIGPISRFIAVVDSYDALTSHRPYRDALSPYEALLRIRADAGERIDGEAFVSLVRALGRDLRADRAAIASPR
jgi:hypothetical protein